MKKFITFLFLSLCTFVFGQQTHTVSKGDTPYSISKKYGINLNKLYQLNPGLEGGTLAIGQKLRLSSNASVASSGNSSTEFGYVVLQPKQTLYGITKQFRVTETELRTWNPNLEMKIGERIKLPMDKIQRYGGNQVAVSETKEAIPPTVNEPKKTENYNTYSTTEVSNDQYLIYKVQHDDTTFGIVNKFGVSLDELINLNPSLSSGLKQGMDLKIKKLDSSYVKNTGDELNVVLMLPFGYDAGESKYRTMSMEFLSGAKLAIERNAKRGQKLNVKVIDAGSEATFKNTLVQINKDNTDLIVGPFFKSSLLEVLDYVNDRKIPVVAPFANSEELHNFGNLIIVETNERDFADRIITEAAAVYSDQKIYIIAGNSKVHANYIQSNLSKKLKNAQISIVNSSSDIIPEKNMMTGQSAPVIAILADDSDAEGSRFVDRMIDLSSETGGNKAFSMYYHSKFESKQDELGKANLVYLMDRKINMEGSFEKEILSDFDAKYCKSPSKYAVIGFDVMNDMLTRENKSGEIFKQMNKSQTQLATKFEFQRVKSNGAYVNTGYRVVRLIP